MPSEPLRHRIIEFLRGNPGATDREITDATIRPGALQQPVNHACRRLETEGVLERRRRPDGRIGNYVLDAGGRRPLTHRPRARRGDEGGLSEDEVKRAVDRWLRSQGWEVRIVWGRRQGCDIEATRGGERWIIEAKGEGSRPEMWNNYFLGILGELLQRMDDPRTRYSIALPEHRKFRRLWEELPALAKSRTGITALFVERDGRINPSGSETGEQETTAGKVPKEGERPRPFTPEQKVILRILMRGLKPLGGLVIRIEAIRKALVRKGVITSEELEVARKEIEAGLEVEKTLNPEIQAAEEDLQRFLEAIGEDEEKEG